MPIPNFDACLYPLLRVLATHPDGLVTRDAVEKTADFLGLTAEDRREVLASGNDLVHRNRIAWAHHHLKAAGLSSSPRWGLWKATSAGLRFAKEHPDGVNGEKGTYSAVQYAGYDVGVVTVDPMQGDTASDAYDKLASPFTNGGTGEGKTFPHWAIHGDPKVESECWKKPKHASICVFDPAPWTGDLWTSIATGIGYLVIEDFGVRVRGVAVSAGSRWTGREMASAQKLLASTMSHEMQHVRNYALEMELFGSDVLGENHKGIPIDGIGHGMGYSKEDSENMAIQEWRDCIGAKAQGIIQKLKDGQSSGSWNYGKIDSGGNYVDSWGPHRR